MKTSYFISSLLGCFSFISFLKFLSIYFKYNCKLDKLEFPKILLTTATFAPPFKRCIANECLSVVGFIFFLISAFWAYFFITFQRPCLVNLWPCVFTNKAFSSSDANDSLESLIYFDRYNFVVSQRGITLWFLPLPQYM